ncbi:hypothetical protein JIN82_00995 [Persicirhabdus sediminis]|uniref:Uncharacterized protein n=2 Tax=Persicirhabdus sediminis TaxID=454144 RepID=A0A8J7SKD1_9BACT|nr:hypothetical protein [Persicirhabdus sediminis]
MRTLLIASSLFFWGIHCSHADISRDFFCLSVASQNAHAEFEVLATDVAVDPELASKYRKEIQQYLLSLVEKGALVQIETKFQSPDDLGEEKQNSFMEDLIDIATSMAPKYGYYTSLEMVGCGVGLKLRNIQRDEPIAWTFSVPKEYEKRIQTMIALYK